MGLLDWNDGSFNEEKLCFMARMNDGPSALFENTRLVSGELDGTGVCRVRPKKINCFLCMPRKISSAS
jgi:hypothetical protein